MTAPAPYPTSPAVLTPTAPDFEGIYSALESDLLNLPSGSWNDLATSGTGAALMRHYASVGAFAQGSIARALQESYLDTARSPSGVLRAVRLQGAHVIRRRPGQLEVTVTRTDSSASTMVIPARTQWNVGGTPFYNPSTITLSVTGASAVAILNVGVVTYVQYASAATPYQIYVLGTPGSWTVSDVDVWMTDSSGTTWSAIRTGLWTQHDGQTTFFESTLPDGTVECKFGDGTYGTIPPAGPLTFTYIALGTAASTSSLVSSGATGAATGFAVTAVADAPSSPNIDQPSPEFYKAVGPGQAANNGRAVTRDDHRALALQYPGVIDALFRAQAEYNPADLRWSNVVSATLLTTSTWTQVEWLQFKRYIESVGIAQTNFIRVDPVAVVVDVTMRVRIFPAASTTAVQALAAHVIRDFFLPSNQSLSYPLEPSDLHVAIKAAATYLQAPGESGPLVDYTDLVVPAGPVSVLPGQYMVLGNLTLDVAYTSRGINTASSTKLLGM